MEDVLQHSYDASQVQVMGIDADGTMTDTFFVRADGRFVVGKSQSNPDDERPPCPRDPPALHQGDRSSPRRSAANPLRPQTPALAGV